MLQKLIQNKNVTIGERNDSLVSSFIVEELSCVNDSNTKSIIQTRYNSEDSLPCEIKKLSDTKVLVQLKEPAFGVAPGQFGVIYNGTKVVCGGRISPKVLEEFVDE